MNRERVRLRVIRVGECNGCGDHHCDCCRYDVGFGMTGEFCSKYDQKARTCGDYEGRPQQCKEFPRSAGSAPKRLMPHCGFDFVEMDVIKQIGLAVKTYEGNLQPGDALELNGETTVFQLKANTYAEAFLNLIHDVRALGGQEASHVMFRRQGDTNGAGFRAEVVPVTVEDESPQGNKSGLCVCSADLPPGDYELAVTGGGGIHGVRQGSHIKLTPQV